MKSNFCSRVTRMMATITITITITYITMTIHTLFEQLCTYAIENSIFFLSFRSEIKRKR